MNMGHTEGGLDIDLPIINNDEEQRTGDSLGRKFSSLDA